jgi:diaminohydroxyphosphoribosylaminopyrimidine deaminase / 5-amino-6-(5-phosphoribosylamino)uracil reductase
MVYMKQALSLARLALGQASPNPAVGAVVLKEDVVVGLGYTQPAGSHHAEILALNQAGEMARGGVMYVTLEPCCHFGRTPPCTKAIIEAGITEVHMAMIDPNPAVAGKGRAELEHAGIKTYLGENEDEAKEITEAYVKYITTGMPFVTAKFAISLDGKIATRTGDSHYISGGESQKCVHNLRYISDAIMCGINTVLHDDPQLTARCCGGRGGTAKRQPLRVITDSAGRTPLGARLFREPGSTLLAFGRKAPAKEKAAFKQAGAEIVELPSSGGMVDLKSLLKTLGEREITSVLVEGGGILLGSFFDQGLVEKVIVFIAPIIIGGTEARMAVAGHGVDRLSDSIRLERVKTEKLGDDLVMIGYITPRPVKA